MQFRLAIFIVSFSSSSSFIRLTQRRTMDAFRSTLLLFCILLYFVSDVNGLKCRAATEAQQGNDFEYVVRMCLRHLRNESDIYDLYRMQSDYDSGRNKRHRDDSNNNDNRNYYDRDRGYPDGFNRWSPNSNPQRNRYDDDRNRQEGDFEESDYYGIPRNGKDGRQKYKQRPQMPHSYQQQLQHDRDMYNRGIREQGSYFHSNKNKNKFNKSKNSESSLTDIDPCVIHCIFQEMQMVDDNGKPNKGLISQKMTQRIRNSELKTFIQDSVDECFGAIDDVDYNNYGGNRQRKPETMCEWAKTFAMCLEDRGRENCDDWNEPIEKSNYNNNSNNKNNEDQRHKSKQNDRG